MTIYLYDPSFGESEPYATIEAALDAASSLIAQYRDQCDPEWPEEIDGVAIFESDDPESPEEGKMLARTVEFNRVDKPDDVDSDGYSPSLGLTFFGVDYYTDYKMEVVA
ncbi:hypothetical protein [Rhizobium sp. P007]|uniref:hypothetical protein n=1 Tax=Rhizobium sp. P007 TaxID=285908 RepID=UPI00115B3D1E|nr:hypothetical protein [Rhizobium sp. P007]CAD7059038.1 hypothetical protein RP007_05895 [Rhizobium sp. P007]